MATNFSVQAAANRSSKSAGWAYEKKCGWGSFEVTDSGPMAANSIIYMVKIPKGAMITGGRVYGDPIDSSQSGSASASIHVGLSMGFTGIDGTVYGSTTATACLMSSLALGPDCAAVTGYKQTNIGNVPFGGLVVINGPLAVADEGYVQVTWTASALALTSGTLNVEVEYYTATLS